MVEIISVVIEHAFSIVSAISGAGVPVMFMKGEAEIDLDVKALRDALGGPGKQFEKKIERDFQTKHTAGLMYAADKVIKDENGFFNWDYIVNGDGKDRSANDIKELLKKFKVEYHVQNSVNDYHNKDHIQSLDLDTDEGLKTAKKLLEEAIGYNDQAMDVGFKEHGANFKSGFENELVQQFLGQYRGANLQTQVRKLSREQREKLVKDYMGVDIEGTVSDTEAQTLLNAYFQTGGITERHGQGVFKDRFKGMKEDSYKIANLYN